MKRGTVWGAAMAGLACLMSLSACSGGDAASGELEAVNLDDLTIRQYLGAQGYSEVRIRGAEVWVEEDAYYDKEELLNEIDIVGFEATPGQTPQGYYYFVQNVLNHTQAYHQPRAATTFVRFDANVPEPWRQAFRQAMALWGNASSTDCVGFREGTGPTGSSQITVTVAEAGTADDGGPAGAVAKLPTLYRASTILSYYIVGSSIKVDPSVTGWTDTSAMRRLALHEMGHTLGFKHPWKGSQIQGTARNANGDACCTGSYASVMDYSGTPTVPSADDVASLAVVFKKKDVLDRFGNVTGQTCDY